MQHPRFKMHKYVWAWVTVFATFMASFPAAMIRVSQTNKFGGQPLNSLTCEGQVPTQRTVTEFATCAQLNLTSNSDPGTGSEAWDE